MKRIAAFTILAACAAALLLAMLPARSARAEVEPSVGYTVTFTEGSKVVSVRMYFQATESDQSVRSVASPLPDGYFLVKEATDAAGNQLTVTRDGSAWKIAGTGRVNVGYDVDLSTLGELTPEQTGVNNPSFSPFMPHAGDGYFFFPGTYLFLQPGSPGPCGIGYGLPDGWNAWESPGGVFVSRAAAVEAEGRNILLTAVQPQASDPANLAGQQEFTDRMAALVAAADGAWGKHTAGERLLLCLGRMPLDTVDNQRLLSIPLDPLYGCVFVPVGTRENILSTDFLVRAGDQTMRSLLWEMNMDPSALWFREGCVHYSNLRFAQLNGWVSEDHVYDQLGSDYALYVDALAQSGTSLAGAGEQALQEPLADLLYGGGTIAVTSIDIELAEKDKSLDGFIAHLLQLPSAELTNQRILDELWAYAGVDSSAFFNDYVTGTATIPASAFSQLKLDGNTEGGGNSGETAGTAIEPAPAFGNGWILMAGAIILVFAIPFLLEPYTLRPRGGAVVVTEEELEAERAERKKKYWGEHHGEDTGKESREPGGGEPGEETPGDGLRDQGET